jgi:hypothetical protein
MSDGISRPGTCPTALGQREETAADVFCPTSSTTTADSRLGSWSCSCTPTGAAIGFVTHSEGAGNSCGSFQQLQIEHFFDVGTAALSSPSTPPTSAEETADQIIEYLRQIDVDAPLRRHTAVGQTFVTIAVVNGPLLRVLEDLVGFRDLVILLENRIISGVLVRVVLFRQSAIRFGYLRFRGCPRYTQNFVITTFGHSSSTAQKVFGFRGRKKNSPKR